MARTLADRFAAGLKATGSNETESKSRKYRTFTRPMGGYYFIGKSGALRYGTASTRSTVVPDRQREALLAAGDAALTKG